MGSEEHKKEAAKAAPVRVSVVTVSDTRDPETDDSGQLIKKLLSQHKHEIEHYVVIPDDVTSIDDQIASFRNSEQQCLILNGGTGVSTRDVTVDVVRRHLDKEIPGFGELFRYLSFGQIGSSAMMSRAIAGTVGNKVIFSLPGSTNAVLLALKRLILPELKHLIWELQR